MATLKEVADLIGADHTRTKDDVVYHLSGLNITDHGGDSEAVASATYSPCFACTMKHRGQTIEDLNLPSLEDLIKSDNPLDLIMDAVDRMAFGDEPKEKPADFTNVVDIEEAKKSTKH